MHLTVDNRGVVKLMGGVARSIFFPYKLKGGILNRLGQLPDRFLLNQIGSGDRKIGSGENFHELGALQALRGLFSVCAIF